MNRSFSPLQNRVNAVLLVLIIVVNCFTIIYPFTPLIQYYLFAQTKGQKLQEKYSHKPEPQVSLPNMIVIPSIGLEAPVVEGGSASVLYQGVWHLPSTPKPKAGTNPVYVAHRFSYIHPDKAFFYNLDKVSIGDAVYIQDNNRRILYSVDSISVVDPNNTSIEQQVGERRITLYTCTPLWSATQRLVITAKEREFL